MLASNYWEHNKDIAWRPRMPRWKPIHYTGKKKNLPENIEKVLKLKGDWEKSTCHSEYRLRLIYLILNLFPLSVCHRRILQKTFSNKKPVYVDILKKKKKFDVYWQKTVHHFKKKHSYFQLSDWHLINLSSCSVCLMCWWSETGSWLQALFFNSQMTNYTLFLPFQNV